MERTHRPTGGSLRRLLAVTAAGAMAFTLAPAQGAVAQEAQARDIQQPGDPCEDPRDAGFPDIVDPRIDHAADCLNDFGIAYGFEDGTYRPSDPISREQMASFLARKLQAADQYQAPTNVPASDFEDRDRIAQVHLASVDLVAHEGIAQGFPDNTYRPAAFVTRGQMASFIVREMETITGQDISTTTDYFDDDDGNTHEDNINVLAEFGIAEGDVQGNYNPAAPVTRGQMALFIARNVDALDNELGITFTSIREDADTQPPVFESASATANDNVVTVIYDEPIDCTTVDLDASDYEVTTTTEGQEPAAREELAAECVTPVEGADTEVAITLAGDPLVEGDTVTIAAVEGTDGDTVLDLAGNEQPVGDETSTVASPDANAPLFEAASAAVNETEVSVIYDELVDCTTVDLNASNYEVTTTIEGEEPVTRDATAAACVTPIDGADDEIAITILGDPLIDGQTVTVVAQTGDDGDTVLDLAANEQPVGDEVTTVVTPS